MGGTLVTRFVRIPISILHWKMVSLMLKGATSNARLYNPVSPTISTIWAGVYSRRRILQGPSLQRNTFLDLACRYEQLLYIRQ